jgi:hypothetical protein
MPVVTKIQLAADAFAYLPIHILGFLAPKFENVDFKDRFKVGVVADGPLSGDLGCIKALEQGLADIVVCDPFAIATATNPDDYCVIGGLIRKSCFWIVSDDTNADDVSKLQVSFALGHTDDLITGKKWMDRCISRYEGWRNSKIQTFGFGDVVDAAAALSKKLDQNSSTRRMGATAAITASILNLALIVNRDKNREKWKVHRLFATKEGEEYLTTAFLCKRDKLTDPKFRKRAAEYLAHVMYAINIIRSMPVRTEEIVVNICADPTRFIVERGKCSVEIDETFKVSVSQMMVTNDIQRPAVENVSISTIKYALEHLKTPDGSDIFSNYCKISKNEWEQAKLNYGVAEEKITFREFYDESIVNDALRVAGIIAAGNPTGELLESSRSRVRDREVNSFFNLVFSGFSFYSSHLAWEVGAKIPSIALFTLSILSIVYRIFPIITHHTFTTLSRIINSVLDFILKAIPLAAFLLGIWSISAITQIVWSGCDKWTDAQTTLPQLITGLFDFTQERVTPPYKPMPTDGLSTQCASIKPNGISNILAKAGGLLNNADIQRDDVYFVFAASIACVFYAIAEPRAFFEKRISSFNSFKISTLKIFNCILILLRVVQK